MASSNILGLENSPYLLQHAHNPVYWQTWEKTDFQSLQKNNTLILISIGYATCHWCHVMENECFESESVADYMNANFHNIKIDREERPDLDQIYMQALQLLTGQGGWPLNIVALPDGRPIWGCTYLPKEQWLVSLEKLVGLQNEKPEYLIEYASQFEKGLLESQKSLIENDSKKRNAFSEYISQMLAGNDSEWGGFKAPKFPVPVQLSAFQIAAHLNNNKAAQQHVTTTLTKICMGGIYDAVEGGFSRYSVDERWHVPHFEKMGYDNGQLLSLLSEAYLKDANPLYLDRINSSFAFLENNLLQENGGFSCALDADSLNVDGKQEEGAYYVWEKEELQALLKDDYPLFDLFYNDQNNGLWKDAKYVLFQTLTEKDFAASQQIPLNSFLEKRNKWRHLLLQARLQRARPLVDTKVLSSWNAQIISGLCKAYRASFSPDIENCAKQALYFMQNEMIGKDGKLVRVWKKDKEAFLEDYALLIQAFITAYQSFFDSSYLLRAKLLFEYCLEHFYDPEKSFFYFKNKEETDSLFNPIEVEDNVIPSSNAVMTENQWLLGRYFMIPEWKEHAKKRVDLMQSQIASYPKAYALWIQLGLLFEKKEVELVIAGPEATNNLSLFLKQYQPQLSIAVCDTMEEAAKIPCIENRFEANSTQFYVCLNQSCLLPTRDINSALAQLEEALRTSQD